MSNSFSNLTVAFIEKLTICFEFAFIYVNSFLILFVLTPFISLFILFATPS
ncbi:hypothetical protein D3C81_878360 [compost metagenome]